MYFWNIEALKDEIREGHFTDKQAIPYIVLTTFLYTLGMELVYYFPAQDSHNIWDVIDSILSIVIPLFAIMYAYKKNGGGEGRDFANKFFSIGFVLSIRFLVYSIVLLIVMIVYWSYIDQGDKTEETTLFEVVIFHLWYILYYYRLGKHIEETHTGSK